MATTLYIDSEKQNAIIKRLYPGETINQFMHIALKRYLKARDLEQLNVK